MSPLAQRVLQGIWVMYRQGEFTPLGAHFVVNFGQLVGRGLDRTDARSALDEMISLQGAVTLDGANYIFTVIAAETRALTAETPARSDITPPLATR